MNPNYKGMRWLKCDLQMQTPADSQHWRGDPLRSGQEEDAAREFVEACYQRGLNVIGVTDHNFLSKEFIPYLQRACEQLQLDHGHCLTIFPGFEFEAAGVGRGVHVLCLFEPDVDLNLVDNVLTECGVRYPRINAQGELEKSPKNLVEILQIVQDKHGGIVILPHALSNDGIFDNDSVSEWLQREQYVNPELLAVEVPKPVTQMSTNFQKLFQSGDDCFPTWKRIRPIATVMSSDNKKLIENDTEGNPVPNSIGYRYTWIKMTEPSVESLRQAFLDHKSRILLPEDVVSDVHPAQREPQLKIKSISIKNVAFLADQEVHFSSGMNCVIGGRGSGKSTLLEYLRIMLGKADDPNLDTGTQERIDRIKSTLSGEATEVQVCWCSAEGIEDCIVWEDGEPKVTGEDLPDPGTYFKNLPVTFYSQQQLNRLTEASRDDGNIRQAQRLLELIDGFVSQELSGLDRTERGLQREIEASFTDLRKATSLDRELKQLQQEYRELDRQWTARQEIQEDARRHQLLKAETQYLDNILGSPGECFQDVSDLARRVADNHTPFDSENSPHHEWFQQFDERVRNAKEEMARAISQAVDQFHTSVEQLKTGDPQWSAIQQELESADSNFQAACQEKGLSTDDVGRLQEISELRATKTSEIEELDTQIQQLRESAGDPEEKMTRLHQLWRSQYQLRQEAANRANSLATLQEENRRFIEVSSGYQQDKLHFLEVWREFGPKDGRTRLSRVWDIQGESLFRWFTENPEADSPWQLVQTLLQGNTEPEDNPFGDSWPELAQHVRIYAENWEKLRRTRIRDGVDMTLYRLDGSKAGSIEEGSLSDGQRNTAALALLLAQEGGPLVIDQPEDELDSNFVFSELIPMLRRVKVNRQLIMATHNANLPVNGDSELVYALEAKDGKGVTCAQGGLDLPDVTKAVLDIMEGSEEAFRKRREKYRF